MGLVTTVKEPWSIVVVDDDDSFRALASEVLGRSGYQVREVATGEEALDEIRLEQPSLVLIDVRLEGMSGYDVCRVLRARYGDDLPIVFVSGERTEPFDRVAGLRLGADDYIVKPFDPDELLARVDRLVSRTRSGIVGPASTSFRLTRREVDVLKLLVGGLRTKEIAQELSISKKTVATHIHNILTKFGVHSQAQAITAALGSGFVSNDNGRGAHPQAPRSMVRDAYSVPRSAISQRPRTRG